MNFGFHNIIDGNGFGVMLTGMLIVFVGLVILVLVIMFLAKLVDKKKRPQRSLSQNPDPVELKPSTAEIIAVASLVIHMESERSLGELAQTPIQRQSRHGSIWTSVGKMHSLSEGGSHA